MGGNAIFNGKFATPIVIENHSDRQKIQCDVYDLLREVDDHVKAITDDYLWMGKYYYEYAAGSTFHLLDEKRSTADLLKYKDTFGDIDIQFDKNRLGDLIMTLVHMGKSFSNKWKLQGFENKFDTVVTLWTDRTTLQNIQVDFECVDHSGYYPTEWARFSRSSAWEDLEHHIKGFAHKLVFRAITACDLFETNIQLKTKTVRRKITPVVFSPKGARVKYRYLGPDLYEEIPMDESYLIKDVEGLFRLFFVDSHEPVTPEEYQLMWSFVGVVELIKRHADPSEYQTIQDGFTHLLWGQGAQKLYRDNPTLDQLYKMKAAMWMAQELKTIPYDMNKIIEYYQVY